MEQYILLGSLIIFMAGLLILFFARKNKFVFILALIITILSGLWIGFCILLKINGHF